MQAKMQSYLQDIAFTKEYRHVQRISDNISRYFLVCCSIKIACAIDVDIKTYTNSFAFLIDLQHQLKPSLECVHNSVYVYSLW